MEFFNKQLIEKAIKGNRVFSLNNTKRDFNNAFQHILNLLGDSTNLYLNNSYPTAIFLAITAIEETAKAEIGLYQDNQNNSEILRRNKDPLFKHKQKHQIALIGTVIMGARIKKALGTKRAKELLNIIHAGKLAEIRENALYFYTNNNIFYYPAMVINKKLAGEILLLAIECLDDRLIGYTSYTMSRRDEVDNLFQSVNTEYIMKAENKDLP